MKSSKVLFVFVILLTLSSCSGSDTYRGQWFATDSDGNKVEFFFNEKEFTFTDADGEKNVFEYRQHSINISNGVETYGITLDDGRELQIHFPVADDESTGMIYGADGSQLYTISRKEYPDSDGVIVYTDQTSSNPSPSF